MPDLSYAGYQRGEQAIPITDFLTIDKPNLVLRGEAAIAPSYTSQARSPT